MLDDRVALVTGAAGGLGRAICAVLEREGARVVRVDIQGEGCLRADAGSEDGCRRMVEAALAEHGRLDILVPNAGVQHLAPIAEFAVPDWDRLMDILLKGPFLAIRHAWPALTARPGGRIVVTASTAAYVGEAYKAAYVAAKHGVAGLVKVAAREGGAHGLTANAVAPGWVWTGLAAGQLDDQARLHGETREDVLARMAADNPAGRLVEPVEVAELVGFLASARASGISGTCIPVDLGAIA